MDEPGPNGWDEREYTAQERSALAIWLLLQRPMTTAAVARRVGLEPKDAWAMLRRISRAVPLYLDRERGAWCICRETASESATSG